MWEIWVWSLGQEDSLESMATHSNVLAWRIPMNREAWQATVYRVTKNCKRLSTEGRVQGRRPRIHGVKLAQAQQWEGMKSWLWLENNRECHRIGLQMAWGCAFKGALGAEREDWGTTGARGGRYLGQRGRQGRVWGHPWWLAGKLVGS